MGELGRGRLERRRLARHVGNVAAFSFLEAGQRWSGRTRGWEQGDVKGPYFQCYPIVWWLLIKEYEIVGYLVAQQVIHGRVK